MRLCGSIVRAALAVSCVVAPLREVAIGASDSDGFNGQPGMAMVWVGGIGTWSDPSNWMQTFSMHAAPVGVLIDSGNPIQSVVMVDTRAAIDGIQIDKNDVVVVQDGRALMIGGQSDSSSMLNAGEVVLDASDQITSLEVTTDLLILAHGGRLRLTHPNRSRIVGASTDAWLLNIDNTIQGTGMLGAGQLGLVNTGTILANVLEHPLEVKPGQHGAVNLGLMQASEGGRLVLVGTIKNDGGVLHAMNASRVDIGGASITGGLLISSGTGFFNAYGAPVSLGGISLASLLEIGPTRLTLTSGIQNDGHISFVAQATTRSPGPAAGELVVPTEAGDVVLEGGGTLSLAATQVHSGDSGAAGHLINGRRHHIHGDGLLGMNQVGLTNLGIITADGTTAIVIDPPNAIPVHNSGQMHAISSAGVVVTGGAFRNEGAIDVHSGSRFVFTADATVLNVADATLDGGVWRVSAEQDEALLLIPAPGIFFNQADVTLCGPGSVFALIDTMTVNCGRLALCDGRTFTTTGTAFSNCGVLELGTGGRFIASGGMTFDASSELRIELSDAADDDLAALVTVNQAAVLDGVLQITLADGYLPKVGQPIVCLTAAQTVGSFRQVTVPPGFRVSYDGQSVLALYDPTCLGDLDGNGVIDTADLVQLIAQWGACPKPPVLCAGDLDSDGLIEVSDLLILVSAWSVCPQE